MKKAISIVLSAVLCFMFIIPVTAQENLRAAYKEEVKMNTFRDIGDFSPYSVTDDVEYEAMRYVFDCLYYIDENDRAKEMMGHSLFISDDNMEYRITLRDNLKWHDGSTITVDDVVFTFENAKNVAWYKNCVRALESVSAEGNTIIFRLKYADPVFMKEAITYVPIVPKAYYEKGEYVSVGSGAYMILEINEGKSYVLGSTDYYLTDVNAGRIVIDILGSEQECAKAVIRGEYWSTFGNLGFDSFNLYDKDIHDVINIYGMTSDVFFMNNENPYLSDVNLRKAVSKVIDYDKIVNEVYGGKADKGSPGFFNQKLGYANKELEYNNNIDEAKQLLLNSGYGFEAGILKDKNHSTVSFNILIKEGQPQKIAEIIREGLLSIGINAEIVSADKDGFLEKLKSGDYQTAIVNLGSYYQYCESNLNLLLNDEYANYSRYKSNTLGDALNKYAKAMDVYERHDALMQLQTLIGEEAPFITLCYPKQLNAYEKGVYNTFAYKEGVGIYSVLSFITNKKSIAADGNTKVLMGPEKGSISMFAVSAIIIGIIALGFASLYFVNRYKNKGTSGKGDD